MPCFNARWIAIALLTLTTSCAAGSSEPIVAKTCPPVKDYSRAFQAQVLAERQAHCAKDTPGMCAMLDDYGDARDEARLCRK